MEFLIYLLTGLFIGGLIGYFVFKSTIQKNHIPKPDFENLRQQFTELQVDHAKRISKEELNQQYISKTLFESVSATLSATKNELTKKQEEAATQQETIVKLTGESEQKLSKAAIEKNYVAKESFDIISRKLYSAEAELISKEQTILSLHTRLTGLEQKEEHLNEKLDLFKTEIESLHNLSKEQFRNLATDIMKEKKAEFVQENKKELSFVIDPFKNDLKAFKEKVEATRKEDIHDLTSLKKELELLQQLNTQLSDDAKNLTSALKSEVKMQGNWGEDRLNMILEAEGLQKYIDYTREEMYRDTDAEINRKPDFILNLPNGKHLIIDSKVSLTAYVNYFNASDPEEKKIYLKQHLRSVNDHIEKLADKTYQSLAGLTTPDYVFMFMPVEPALTLAINQSPEVINNALKRKIVLITPTTLIATLKVVKIIWQKENQVKNVEGIFKQCGALYDKFVGFAEDMIKIKAKLKDTSDTCDDAMNKLKDGKKRGDTIIGRLENIKRLEATTNKTIPQALLTEIELLEDDDVKLLD
jgi:DNA recombination protein RmuC